MHPDKRLCFSKEWNGLSEIQKPLICSRLEKGFIFNVTLSSGNHFGMRLDVLKSLECLCSRLEDSICFMWKRHNPPFLRYHISSLPSTYYNVKTTRGCSRFESSQLCRHYQCQPGVLHMSGALCRPHGFAVWVSELSNSRMPWIIKLTKRSVTLIVKHVYIRLAKLPPYALLTDHLWSWKTFNRLWRLSPIWSMNLKFVVHAQTSAALMFASGSLLLITSKTIVYTLMLRATWKNAKNSFWGRICITTLLHVNIARQNAKCARKACVDSN